MASKDTLDRGNLIAGRWLGTSLTRLLCVAAWGNNSHVDPFRFSRREDCEMPSRGPSVVSGETYTGGPSLIIKDEGSRLSQVKDGCDRLVYGVLWRGGKRQLRGKLPQIPQSKQEGQGGLLVDLSHPRAKMAKMRAMIRVREIASRLGKENRSRMRFRKDVHPIMAGCQAKGRDHGGDNPASLQETASTSNGDFLMRLSTTKARRRDAHRRAEPRRGMK
ncbi:hypothetical protein HRG_014114 [Hirsutella rhossiliensis]